jgi:DNA-binding LytR/AlgR family response regulator
MNLIYGKIIKTVTKTVTKTEVKPMLKIAICDDMSVELQRISVITKEYLSIHSLNAEVRDFSHPDVLLTACEQESFHIFLLDMVMPMVSGIELGRSIRRVSTDAQIIYITTEPGFALDAYAVNPLHYLLKPVDKAALFTALDLATQKVNFGEKISVTVKTKAGLRTLSADTVICGEYVRHIAVYTLTTGERVETVTLSGSFGTHIEPLLKDKRFISPHAAFVLNMSFVERLDKEGFTLRGGIFVPVSGKHYTAVRNAYMSYRLGEGCK